MEIFHSIITAVLCLSCFLCCKGWSMALSIGASKTDKRMIKLARTFGIAGDVFHCACWLFIVAGFLKAFGLF